MVHSKRKGAAGERELAAFLRRYGIEARRSQQYCGTESSADLIADLPGIHIECKRTEALSVYKAVEQAQSDCGGLRPLVCHRRSRKDWLAILPLKDLLELLGYAQKSDS